MSETTEGERASIIGEHKLHGKDIILRLVQDADRLAQIERQVQTWERQLDKSEEITLRACVNQLRAIIDPSDREG